MYSTLATPALGSQLHLPTIQKLSNGLTLIVEQTPVEAINLSIWLGIGSSVESESINGIAHFLEHMIFKGTPQIPCGEFERALEARGAVTNAATSQDYTHYYVTAAPQDFAVLAPLQIELLINSSLETEAFERERPVILEEIRRSEDNARRRNFYRFMELAFDQLPYRRQVLGPASVIADLSVEQMRLFHRSWYQPDHMTAVAVGNLPAEQLMSIVADSFEQALSRRDQVYPLASLAETPASRRPEPSFSQIRRLHYADKTLRQARLVMSWRVPGMNDLAQTYALDVIASILGQGRTSRLVRDLREEQQLVDGVVASNMSYRQQGLFSISAQLPAEHLQSVEASIISHISRLQNTPIALAELQRVQTQVANRYIFGSETPSDRAGLYGYYQALAGDISHALSYPASIRAITLEDLQQAAQRYLSPEAYAIMTVVPE
ncbi:M16 family metallopeptidase [Almyronema epifaneia]|uniref:M16 family metallopeptidase n=1 Tax=Almyronema epifaneia S1 TaxID=2991925 RepID=A0ABW6II06_9CYAN